LNGGRGEKKKGKKKKSSPEPYASRRRERGGKGKEEGVLATTSAHGFAGRREGGRRGEKKRRLVAIGSSHVFSPAGIEGDEEVLPPQGKKKKEGKGERGRRGVLGLAWFLPISTAKGRKERKGE